jgi:hypothetical protein
MDFHTARGQHFRSQQDFLFCFPRKPVAPLLWTFDEHVGCDLVHLTQLRKGASAQQKILIPLTGQSCAGEGIPENLKVETARLLLVDEQRAVESSVDEGHKGIGEAG